MFFLLLKTLLCGKKLDDLTILQPVLNLESCPGDLKFDSLKDEKQDELKKSWKIMNGFFSDAQKETPPESAGALLASFGENKEKVLSLLTDLVGVFDKFIKNDVNLGGLFELKNELSEKLKEIYPEEDNLSRFIESCNEAFENKVNPKDTSVVA